MIKMNKPIFLSLQEINKIQTEKKKALAICQCPFPILATGQWVHIVNYNEDYKCSNCGIEFRALKGSNENDS